jgi:hypothetical protein
MICCCPYCLHQLPEILIDGVTFCENCSRIITSNKLDELLCAYKLIKKRKYPNYDQLKFHLQLSKEDLNYIVDCYEKDDLTIDEFIKKTKTLYR